MISAAMSGIPELEGVAVFFSWNMPDQASMPTMVSVARDGQIRHPSQLYRMLHQVLKGQKVLAEQFMLSLTEADTYAGMLAERIQKSQQTLQTLNAEIQQRETDKYLLTQQHDNLQQMLAAMERVSGVTHEPQRSPQSPQPPQEGETPKA